MAQNISYQIDFLPVGDGDRSGDAIAARWWDGTRWHVLIYDGGTQASGQALVDHVMMNYGTTRVDYVVNSHPDADHASGLKVILEQLYVGELWMHQPWNYSPFIRDRFNDGRMTSLSLYDRLRSKMACASEVAVLAKRKGITIREPFQGEWIGNRFLVLSPSRDWYVHGLIPEFEKSPELKAPAAGLPRPLGLARMGAGLSTAEQSPKIGLGLFASMADTAAMPQRRRGLGLNPLLALAQSSRGTPLGMASMTEAAPQRRGIMETMMGRDPDPFKHLMRGLATMPRPANAESWSVDSLREDVTTSAENESSAVLLGFMGDHYAMLTGDAGVRALTHAADYYDTVYQGGIALHLKFIQMPHHGSRNNVSASVLNRILGACKAGNDGNFDKHAFVSVGLSPTHPRQRVVNAFIRRGAQVFETRGNARRFAMNMVLGPNFGGYVPALEFSTKVEPWE